MSEKKRAKRISKSPDGEAPVHTPYEDLFGAEAAVPEGLATDPVSSRFPSEERTRTATRELQRRVKTQLTPLFPAAPRRKPPLDWLWKRYRRLALRDRTTRIDEFGRDPAFSARVEPMLDLLARGYFKLSIRGVEALPEAGAAILVANRAGPAPWDAILLTHAIRRHHRRERPLRPLIQDPLFYAPYLGVILNRIGAVRACKENGLRLLSHGSLVAVFPEKQPGGGVGAFGPGGFLRLAAESGAPLFPVAVEQTPRFAGAGKGPIPAPSHWRFTIGEPLSVSAEDAKGNLSHLAEDLRQRVRALCG